MEQNIDINTIHHDRAHLRESVTDESVKQLADSIRQHGLLQAIVVCQRQGGGYRLIAGRRRLTAYRLLGYTTIPARIIDDPALDEIPALAENLMRAQMNPLEEAKAVQLLHEQKNLSIAEICEYTNHGTSWVQDRLALLNIPTEFQRAVADRAISIGAAFQLMRIKDISLRDYYLHLAKTNGASVHQCQAWANDFEARLALTRPPGYEGDIPQLPQPPPIAQLYCWACTTEHEPEASVLLRLCRHCFETLKAARDQTPTTIEHRPSTQPQSNT